MLRSITSIRRNSKVKCGSFITRINLGCLKVTISTAGFGCEVKAEPMRKLRCIVLCITQCFTINTFSFSASDLPGSTININSGNWIRKDTGVGAGIDSYYEYILKGNFWGHSRFFTVC